jgi:protease-4
MDDAMLQKVADGRVFTGRQAVGLKLIDELGDEKAALAWLATAKNVSADTPVRDYRLSPRFGDMSFLRLAASVTLEAVGLDGLARRLGESGAIGAVDRLGLEGLLALWQPAGTN